MVCEKCAETNPIEKKAQPKQEFDENGEPIEVVQHDAA